MRKPYRHAPSNPVYEPDVVDWARRTIARKLGVYTMSRRKKDQWHDIVLAVIKVAPANVVNLPKESL